ncbi:MAG: hypothetical protein ACYTEZ_04055 [Planctomycetota bacterium]|jgi:hypothetical protein
MILVLFFAACKTPPPASRTYLHTDVFEDIPAPREARYRNANMESFSYRSQSFRCGKFIFDYQGSDADVVRFFKETMTAPPYSWTLTDEDRVQAGSTGLVFVKGEDRCTVEVDVVPQAAYVRHVRIQVRVNYVR